MIRNWDANETGPLLELWLESTIHAHPFIAESYWHDSLAIVRDVYLPVNFYHAQGFRIEDCAWQDETQHPTWIIHWSADQMPSA